MSTATTKLTYQLPARLSSIGQAVSRYGLALALAWIGFGKYIKFGARTLIEHSPLMSWLYDVFSANTVAWGLGTLEITAAILICFRPVSARLSAVGPVITLGLFTHGEPSTKPRRPGSRACWRVSSSNGR